MKYFLNQLEIVPGISGVLMVFILVAIMVTSTRWFRTRYYNAFYYTHFLFAPFLILLVFHPTRYQSFKKKVLMILNLKNDFCHGDLAD